MQLTKATYYVYFSNEGETFLMWGVTRSARNFAISYLKAEQEGIIRKKRGTEGKKKTYTF